MPGFHHSVAILPLPFRCAVAIADENGNAGNVFPYTVIRTLIGCPPTVKWQK